MPRSNAEDAARKREAYAADKAESGAAIEDALQHALSYPATADGLIEWSEDNLKIASGPKIGEFVKIDGEWERPFYHNTLRPDIRESYLCVARKNGKTFLNAILCLGIIAGPLNKPETRIIACSLSLEHVAELQTMIRQTAEVSGIELEVLKTPRPGHIIGRRGARINFLSSSNASGHSVAADWALVDELSLFGDNKAELIANFRAATSGRNGKFVGLSITGPLGNMMLRREEAAKTNPKIYFQAHRAPEDAEITDEDAWRAANPGLSSGIKSLAFMRDAAEMAKTDPTEEYYFKTLHLNQSGEPGKESLVTLVDWKRATAHTRPVRAGKCVVAVDIGAANSMSAAAILFENGRLETLAVFPGEPSLIRRGKADGVGTRYVTMQKRGELATQHGRRSVDVGEFIASVAVAVSDRQVSAFVADRFKQGEVEDALRLCALYWRRVWRGLGFRDGSEDVRAFQRAVLDEQLRPVDTLLMSAALADSAVQRDGAGNQKLVRARQHGKIDVLTAAVLAAGEMARIKAQPQQHFQYAGAV